jgi:hypothetical protein
MENTWPITDVTWKSALWPRNIALNSCTSRLSEGAQSGCAGSIIGRRCCLDAARVSIQLALWYDDLVLMEP